MSAERAGPDRRGFLSKATTLAMGGGLVAGYGTLGVMALRFLYPSGGKSVGWRFVADCGSRVSQVGHRLRHGQGRGHHVDQNGGTPICRGPDTC